VVGFEPQPSCWKASAKPLMLPVLPFILCVRREKDRVKVFLHMSSHECTNDALPELHKFWTHRLSGSIQADAAEPVTPAITNLPGSASASPFCLRACICVCERVWANVGGCDQFWSC
jgi:hypothetical protein